jgi:hypothetical protein
MTAHWNDAGRTAGYAWRDFLDARGDVYDKYKDTKFSLVLRRVPYIGQ